MFFFKKKILERSIFSKIKKFFFEKKEKNYIDLDNIEKILLSADIGTKTTINIIKNLENNVNNNKIEIKIFKKLLYKEINKLLICNKTSLLEKIKNCKNPYVIMIVGVNGVGKTTTIGKLAFLLKNNGFNPIISASDTFREAAIDQLEIWANRAKVPLIKQHINSDPSSVAYDTLQSAITKKKDVVLIDTAGRLHNKINLMEELSKMSRVIKKLIYNAPNETILILDSTTGQNSFDQTKKFISFSNISSIILTKMDGTAKGGFIINIMDSFKIPIQYIGVGEKIEDLKEFDNKKFINSFFNNI